MSNNVPNLVSHTPLNDDKDVITQYRDFIRRSIRCHGDEVKLQTQCLEASSAGKWWSVFFKSDTNNRVLRRARRINLDCNSDIHAYADLIASPLSSSPWAIKLDEPNPELQNIIDKFEAYLMTKETEIMAFTRGVLVGKGWVNLRLEDGEPRLEFIRNATSVYQDPESVMPDNSDAKECAVITHVPASRWKGVARLEIDNTDSWAFTGEDGCGQISDGYYYRNDNGKVTCYHIVGRELMDTYELPFHRIPILCFSGYNDYSRNKGGIYSGIMQKTWDIQLLRNLALSQMADRQNKSIKSKVAYSDKAIAGLSKAVTAAMNDETPVLMYKAGEAAPTMLSDIVSYTDIEQINTYCQTKMDAIIGVTLASQLPTEKTATAVLLREDKRETSVNQLYSHANMVMHSIAKCIMEAICGDVLPYALISGPESVSKNYKLRKDIAALRDFYANDESMNAYLGYIVATTTGNQDLINGMRANLPPDVKLPDANILDVVREATQTQQVAEELANNNEQLEQQLNEANVELNSARAALDDNKRNFELRIAQMNIDAKESALKYEMEISKLKAELAKMEAETAKTQAEATAQELENAVNAASIGAATIGG